MSKPITLKHLLIAVLVVIGAFFFLGRSPEAVPVVSGQLVATDTTSTTTTESKPAPPIYVTVNLPAPAAPVHTEPAPAPLTPTEAATIATYQDTFAIDTLHLRLTAIARTRVQGKLLDRHYRYTINTDSLIRTTTRTITNTIQAPDRLKLYAGAFTVVNPAGRLAVGPELTLTTPAGFALGAGLDAAGWLRTGSPGYAIRAGKLLSFKK